jgi:pyrroloquinoline-quinone synthase
MTQLNERTFTRYEEVERAMDDVVEEYFFRGRFLTQLLSGGYTYPQIRHFAIQYSYYSRHFPRVLGAAISAMPPIDSWWVSLADNLWDEAGRGAPGKSHEKLYLTFLKSVDPDIQLDRFGMPNEPMSPAVGKAIQTFIDFFRDASPLAAMAAVGLGSEMFAGAVMGKIEEGFRHPAYNRDRSINVMFWELHADEHEPHHYQLCKSILEEYTHPADLKTMFDVGRTIARSEAQMYEELHDEMMQL